MKKYSRIILIILLGVFAGFKANAQALDMVLDNPLLTPRPASYPGTVSLSFDFYAELGSHQLSSDDLASNYAVIKISLGLLDGTGIVPTGTGAALFTWTYNPATKTYTGKSKDVLVAEDTFYKIMLSNLPTTQATQNQEVGFIANLTPPGDLLASDPNDDEAHLYTITNAAAVAPITKPDVATTPAGAPVTITATTNDTPGSAAINPASVKLIDPTTNTPVTSVTVPGQGTYTVNPSGTITFTPVAGFTGPATPVSYTVADVNGLVSNPSTISVTVTAVPPTAVPDVVTTPAGSPVTITTTSNDTPGSSPIDPTTVKLIDPNTGTPVTTVTVPNEGTYTVNPNGTITFTPVAGFDGPGTPISYTVKDVDGNTSNPAPITVTVTPVPPTAVPDVVTTPGGTPVTITTTSNDIPGSSPIDPTTVKLIDPNTGTPVTTVTIPNEGTYTVNPNGTITFTPDPGFDGPGTPVSYTVTDVDGHTSNPAPITVTVSPTPPVAVPDVVTTPSGIPVTITTTTNDTPGSSPIDPTSVKLIDPNTGTPVTSVTIPGEGTYTVNPDGTITFTPLVGFNGPSSTVSYTVTDVDGHTSNPATITVNVTPVPPIAVPDVATTTVGTPVVIPVTSNDTPGSSPIDPQMVKLIDPVTGLQVLIVTVPNEGTYSVNASTGQLTFTPVAGFVGTATPISYTVQDNAGSFSNPATITVTVTAVPPTANGDSGNSPNGTPVAVTVLNNDTPGSFPLDPTTVKIIDPNTGTPSTTVTIPGEGTYTVDPGTGVVTFTPDPAVTTPITSTITYTVTDTHGNTSPPATITINATPLPVTLTTFKVTKEGQTAKLDWATTAETNSDHFEIQHSVTGKDWHVIGKVNSHGESTVENKYTFTDANPVAGSENLYRLKMVDKDATFAYSRIQSVKFDGKAADLSVYPNPTTDRIFVRDFSSVKEVVVSDMNGRSVYQSSSFSTGSGSIDVKNLSQGLYVIKVVRQDGTISVQKVAVIK